MNKRMREILDALDKKKTEARQLMENGKKEDAKALVKEIKSLNEEFDIERELYETSKVPKAPVEDKLSDKDKRFRAFNRALVGKSLSAEDKGLIEGTNTDGGYLVPVEQQTQIHEFRRTQISLKSYCNVLPVTTLSGSMPLEVESDDKLTEFSELTEIAQSDIKFGNVTWKLKDKGDIIPVSNTLLQDETANLTTYCGRRFAKKAVRTENADILTLMNSLEAVAGTTYKDINTVLNVKLPSAIKNVSMIITNQSGFDFLDKSREEISGEKILKEDLSSPSGYSYKGKHILVLDDSEMKTSKPTLYIGSLYDFIAFFDRNEYEMAADSSAGFTKNATFLRLIERYDVQKVDNKAMVKLEITVSPEAASVSDVA